MKFNVILAYQIACVVAFLSGLAVAAYHLRYEDSFTVQAGGVIFGLLISTGSVLLWAAFRREHHNGRGL